MLRGLFIFFFSTCFYCLLMCQPVDSIDLESLDKNFKVKLLLTGDIKLTGIYVSSNDTSITLLQPYGKAKRSVKRESWIEGTYVVTTSLTQIEELKLYRRSRGMGALYGAIAGGIVLGVTSGVMNSCEGCFGGFGTGFFIGSLAGVAVGGLTGLFTKADMRKAVYTSQSGSENLHDVLLEVEQWTSAEQ